MHTVQPSADDDPCAPPQFEDSRRDTCRWKPRAPGDVQGQMAVTVESPREPGSDAPLAGAF